MDRLVVDAGVLDTIRGDLDVVGQELEDPARRADVVGEAVGAGNLRAALDEFADGWDRRRGELLEAVRALRDGVETVSTAFDEVEERLGSAVEGGTRAPGGGGR
jgi:hypothetical protein